MQSGGGRCLPIDSEQVARRAAKIYARNFSGAACKNGFLSSAYPRTNSRHPRWCTNLTQGVAWRNRTRVPTTKLAMGQDSGAPCMTPDRLIPGGRGGGEVHPGRRTSVEILDHLNVPCRKPLDGHDVRDERVRDRAIHVR